MTSTNPVAQLDCVMRNLGHEESGLYEAVWDLRNRFPYVDDTTLRDVIAPRLLALLGNGHVILRRAVWSPHQLGDPLPPGGIEDVLRDDRWWSPSQEYICICNSALGEQLWTQDSCSNWPDETRRHAEWLHLAVDELLAGSIDAPAYVRRFYEYYVEVVPDDGLTEREFDLFGSLHEALDWTAPGPSDSDRSDGWLDYDEYVQFARRATHAFDCQSKIPRVHVA